MMNKQLICCYLWIHLLVAPILGAPIRITIDLVALDRISKHSANYFRQDRALNNFA
jgi:hypothetical protein